MPNDILEHLQIIADAKEIAKDFLEAKASLAEAASTHADVVSNLVETVAASKNSLVETTANTHAIADIAEAATAVKNSVIETALAHQDTLSNIVDSTSANPDFASQPVPLIGYKSASDAASANISSDIYNKYHSTGHGLIGVGAGAAMVGASGVGAGQGIAAGRAAEAVGRNPEAAAKIRLIFLIGVAIAESAALYSLVVAALLLFLF